ncbi:MAG TPA: DUF6644 family protein [Xanthobacteraceae bacterium]|nr:DUF6644 family protein [Xanthobacteraceae bacterium]
MWDVIVALEQSGFGTAIRRSHLLYPAANIGHIVFLVLFAGSVAVMDTRLLGGALAAPLSSLVVAVRRIAVVALIGMISTGFMLFSADASKVADNAAFQVKMALIAAALANVAIYEFGARHAVEALAPGDAVPLRARIAGALSIMMWVMVAACGRAIAYL